jgi:hypothetical protein
VAACGSAALASLALIGAQGRSGAGPITWTDTAPLHSQLEARGITSSTFPSYVEGLRQAHARRVREGDLDHLVFYWLQSRQFTPLPSIEPALSARALVESLDSREHAEFLRNPGAAHVQIPEAVRSRLAALLRALDSSSRDARLVYFRSLMKATFPDRAKREAELVGEYVRVMRFVYEKEFVAQRSTRAAEAVAELYRTRGLSTDTEVEAGYAVYLGLGIVKSLDQNRHIRRVLIVGPGLDLAPRTALLEVGPPESYQPWAVIDALLSLGLSRLDDLEVVAADINPRVVEHLHGAGAAPPTLRLLNGIQESETVTLSPEFRDYFVHLGAAIGQVDAGADPKAGGAGVSGGRLQKTVAVGPAAARALRAETLDVVTERFEGPAFDLVIATNILPYFDDAELMLAMSNVAAMLAPGGVFLHNEARPWLQDVTRALGLPFQQSRHAIIADVRGAPAPLFDSVWLHRKPGP